MKPAGEAGAAGGAGSEGRSGANQGPPTFIHRMGVDLDEIGGLTERVEQFAAAGNVPPLQTRRISLAIDELVTNIVKYGTESGKPTDIEVSVRLLEGRVHIEIEHRGVPFDPFVEAPAPDTTLPLEDRPIGGLGVFLVKSLMTSTRYERIEDRNRITLTRSLQAGDQEETPS